MCAVEVCVIILSDLQSVFFFIIFLFSVTFYLFSLSKASVYCLFSVVQ